VIVGKQGTIKDLLKESKNGDRRRRRESRKLN